MAQHDYVISSSDANTGASFRADLNNVLTAIVSQNSGNAAPATTFAYQPWADADGDTLYIRNAANTAWIPLYTISTGKPVALNNVPNKDATNPENITQSSTHRFVTDGEKATWNGKIANVGDDASPQLGGELDTDGKSINFKATAGGANNTASGTITSVTVDTNSVGIGGLLTMSSDGHYDMADADSVDTICFAMAIESGTGTKKVLLNGYIRNDAWNWTVGNGLSNLLYLSTTSGAMTQTRPSGEDDVIQVVGRVITADIVWFEPSMNIITYKV